MSEVGEHEGYTRRETFGLARTTAISVLLSGEVAHAGKLNSYIQTELILAVKNLPRERKADLALIDSVPNALDIFQEILVHRMTEGTSFLSIEQQRARLKNVEKFTTDFQKDFCSRLAMTEHNIIVQAALRVVRELVEVIGKSKGIVV